MGILSELWEQIFPSGRCDFTWVWGRTGQNSPILPAIRRRLQITTTAAEMGLQTELVIYT
jgi:hypothetical protein